MSYYEIYSRYKDSKWNELFEGVSPQTIERAIYSDDVDIDQFAALLSINLAVINILPFPALDGGRVLFLFFEKVRGKAVDTKLEAIVHNLGFLFLMALIVLVTYGDFARYGQQILGKLKSLVGI